MEDRLLEIIKTGNGQVKDLVAAEREVGVWREKVEKVTGEINYYNSLDFALPTPGWTLEERDIRRAALASEKETVDMGIETPDVEKARADAMHALDDAKARIIQADLKKLDAGQLAATIVADVSPDAAGPVIDHFKQLGRVARLNIDRQQTVAEGATVPPGVKVDRLDTRLQVSLYNLANVSPRQTTNVTMACPDVESAYHAIIGEKALHAGGARGGFEFESSQAGPDGWVDHVRDAAREGGFSAGGGAGAGGSDATGGDGKSDAANVTTAKEGFSDFRWRRRRLFHRARDDRDDADAGGSGRGCVSRDFGDGAEESWERHDGAVAGAEFAIGFGDAGLRHRPRRSAGD